MDKSFADRLFSIRQRIVEHFDSGNWEELGLITGASAKINRHPRLLRSLDWHDDDYDGNVLTVIRQMAEENPAVLQIIESYLDRTFPGESTYISAKAATRTITFSPFVFEVPVSQPELDLVAVMMPFTAEFRNTYDTIRTAVSNAGMRALRADDIWEESAIIQDIFNLLFRAQIVVVDFTGKNPNVMYETGIAHTLGKHVIPITQSLDDLPFDMRHHRALKYHPNAEGLQTLATDLARKLRQLVG